MRARSNDGSGLANSGSEAAFVSAVYDPTVCSPNCTGVISDFYADDTEVIDSGLVTLHWSAVNADSFGLMEDGQGTELTLPGGTTSYTTSMPITQTTNYTLRAYNAESGRSTIDHERVTVFTAHVRNEYNAGSQRIRRVDVENGDESIFVFGPYGELLGEYDSDLDPVVEYMFLEGEPLAQVRGDVGAGDTFFVHSDHLGTPQRLTDEYMNEKWAIQLSPFGETVSESSSWATGDEQNVRFPGQYADESTGLNYNWHRYYDPSLGRYISADPIGQRGGINVYNYAFNNPTNLIDPFGLKPGDIFPTRDAAGQDAANYSQCRSQSAAAAAGVDRGPEYGGYLTETADGDFTYAAPTTDGELGRVNIGAPPSNAAGSFHSHTNNFTSASPEDQLGSAESGLSSYIGNSDGSVTKFAPGLSSQPNSSSPYGTESQIQGAGQGPGCQCE